MPSKKSILITLVLVALGTTAFGGSKLRFSAKNFDFGTIPQHAEVIGGYWLFSDGPDTLVINDVKPACGCTKAPLTKNVMAPGDSTYLEITFNSKKYSRSLTKSIRIISNTPGEQNIVTLSANVLPKMSEAVPVHVKPYKFDISQMGEKPREELIFTIENISDMDLNTEIVFGGDDYYDINLPENIKAGETKSGKIKIKKEYLDKEFKRSFTIQFDNPAQTRFTIPVIRNIRELSTSH